MFTVVNKYSSYSLSVRKLWLINDLMLIIQMEKSTVFNSLLVCYQSTYFLTQIRYEGNVSFWRFHGKANDVS